MKGKRTIEVKLLELGLPNASHICYKFVCIQVKFICKKCARSIGYTKRP